MWEFKLKTQKESPNYYNLNLITMVTLQHLVKTNTAPVLQAPSPDL